MLSPDLPKGSSGAAPYPTPVGEMSSKSSPNILEWVLVVLMVVTIAGLGYLYFTLTQLSDSVIATKADVMMVKSEVMAQKETMEEEVTKKRLSELPVHAYVLSTVMSNAEEPPLVVYALHELPRSLWTDNPQRILDQERLQARLLDPIADFISWSADVKVAMMIVDVPLSGSDELYAVDILDERGVYWGFVLGARGEDFWSPIICEGFETLSQEEVDTFRKKYPNFSTCFLDE